METCSAGNGTQQRIRRSIYLSRVPDFTSSQGDSGRARHSLHPTRRNLYEMSAAEITITGWATRDVRFPTSLDKTGSDAMNAAGDYSSAYCILQTDSAYQGHGMVWQHPTDSELPGSLTLHLDLHHRPRQRHRMRGHQPRRRARPGPDTLVPRRRLGKDMAPPRQRQPAPVDRPREGRHSPRTRRRRQRHLGPLGEGPRQARVAHRLRDVARGVRAVRRLPIHYRRHHP